MVEAVIDVDEEYTEGAMTEFLQRKNRRRGEVYVSEGCVDNYQYLLAGRTVGICDLFLADGAAKIEDFVVAPSMQRQRGGGSLLPSGGGHARGKGASTVSRLTAEGATAQAS